MDEREKWYAKALGRYEAAIVLDYVLPFKVIPPKEKDDGRTTEDPTPTPQS